MDLRLHILVVLIFLNAGTLLAAETYVKCGHDAGLLGVEWLFRIDASRRKIAIVGKDETTTLDGAAFSDEQIVWTKSQTVIRKKGDSYESSTQNVAYRIDRIRSALEIKYEDGTKKTYVCYVTKPKF